VAANSGDVDSTFISKTITVTDNGEEEPKKEETKTIKIPKEICVDINQFIKLEDELKLKCKQTKLDRLDVRRCKGNILKWMMEVKKARIQQPKRNLLLLIKEKELRKKPTPEQQKSKLAELVSKGVTDVDVILNELKKCGEVFKSTRLYRRKLKVERKKKPVIPGAPQKKRSKKRLNIETIPTPSSISTSTSTHISTTSTTTHPVVNI